jgi:hypothetical protein
MVCSVTVTQMPLEHLFKVRILTGQPKIFMFTTLWNCYIIILNCGENYEK